MTSPHTTQLNRRAEGLDFKLRRADYEAKMLAINAGQNPILYPADFVQYILDRQSIAVEQFDALIGYGEKADYFRSDVFNTSYNDGIMPLPKPLRAKLAGLTQKSELFWSRKYFYASDATDVTIDKDADISPIIAQYKNAGGRLTRALNHEALQDAHMRGL